MVLQRNTEIKIWGWADENEEITIEFINSTYQTQADENGKWEVKLPQLKAGGPYEMHISGKNEIHITDILIGEVWVSSGQSNMEVSMQRVRPLYESEIAHSRNEMIRYFNLPMNYDFNRAHKDMQSGNWKQAAPENILDFSAISYFYAKKLYQKYQVPVGIINASVGGSPAEAWCSEDVLKKEFPGYYKEAQKFKDSSLRNKITREDNKRMKKWHSTLKQKDKGYKGKKPWSHPNINTSNWSQMEIPGYWADTELGDLHGSVWFRKQIKLTPNQANKPAELLLGRIVNADSVFINDKYAGNTTYQYPPRRYKIPSEILKRGVNTITIRVVNQSGNGGFVRNKPYKLRFGNTSVDLTGTWKYRLGAKMDRLEGGTFIRWKPVGLYNGMISPLLNYKVKGVIWYQGESNTDRALEYEKLFKTMIKNWRNKWNQEKLPFLYVQLANFMEPDRKPSSSNWALLRESQTKTLSLPNTGMAVTTDLGIWNDIHPLNKKDVAQRLALSAQNVAYGEEDIVHSGPLYESMEVTGNKVSISFKHTGSGLVAKGYDDLKHFAIAGRDSNFVWANAKIKDNKVIVWHDKIENPTAVRYGWADNPRKANLYNAEGLPASPFRTDDWEK